MDILPNIIMAMKMQMQSFFFFNKTTIPEIFYLKDEKILLRIIIIQIPVDTWHEVNYINNILKKKSNLNVYGCNFFSSDKLHIIKHLMKA